MTVDVRPLQPAHVAGVRALTDLQPSMRDGLVTDVQRDDRICLVATTIETSEVMGAVLLRLEPGVGHVIDLAVRRDARRQGVATAMLHAAHDAVVASGRPHVTLEYRVSNEAARRLYHGLGYHEVGIRPNEYLDADGHEDGWVAWWPDVPPDVPAGVPVRSGVGARGKVTA